MAGAHVRMDNGLRNECSKSAIAPRGLFPGRFTRLEQQHLGLLRRCPGRLVTGSNRLLGLYQKMQLSSLIFLTICLIFCDIFLKAPHLQSGWSLNFSISADGCKYRPRTQAYFSGLFLEI